MMRKLMMFAIGMLIAGNAMALENEPKQGFTGMAFLGLNATHIKHTVYDGKPGGTMGFRLDYVLPKAHGTYITAGVDWTMKGGKYSTIEPDPNSDPLAPTYCDGTVKAKLHYAEIPIRIGFRYNINKEIGVYGELGPYFAVGLGGKHKLNMDADGAQWDAVEDAQKWKAFKKSETPLHDNFQRWDAGFGFRVGAEYNQHYNLMLGCDWGITDMWRDKYRDAMFAYNAPLAKAKNFNFTLAFGYRF